jgi:hypothetical protein
MSAPAIDALERAKVVKTREKASAQIQIDRHTKELDHYEASRSQLNDDIDDINVALRALSYGGRS